MKGLVDLNGRALPTVSVDIGFDTPRLVTAYPQNE